MTVNSTDVFPITAVGNGSATTFSFSPGTIQQNSDLTVIHVAADGTETTLTEGTGSTNYSVSVTYYPGTGSIVYPATATSPISASESLIIKRVLPLTQETDLENEGGYFPETQELALDKGIMIDQQQQDELDRSVKIRDADKATVSPNLPAPVANNYLAWNADADEIVSQSRSGKSRAVMPLLTVKAPSSTYSAKTSASAEVRTLAM